MKNFLLFTVMNIALVFSAIGQTTLVDFETTSPYVEPFDISYDGTVVNPDASGINTSDSVGKITKISYDWGFASWGGINIPLGGEIQLTGSEQFSVDFYTDAPVPENDSIFFTLEFKNMFDGTVQQFQSHAYYMETGDTTNNTWKTLNFEIPDTISGAYDHIVIFFGWEGVPSGNVVYYDNIVAPGFSEYTESTVNFTIRDKFNNATDVSLFINGAEATLTQTDNEYSTSETLSSSYSILDGGEPNYHEIVYSYGAIDSTINDTMNLLAGADQEVFKLIIVEEPEDGTADAKNVGDNPPIIDGTVDAVWDSAKTHTMQKRNWWGSPTGLYSMWKIMWDIDNVYLLYMIEDDTPHAHNLQESVYINDNVETFFDMNQSASNGFDSDDWQIRTIRGSDLWTGSSNVTENWTANVERAQSEMENNAGYIIEMAIPWSSLSSSFLPLEGAEFNYDCVTSDVTQQGGTRAYRESWATAGDSAYFSTADYGTITLVGSDDSDDTTDTGIQVPETLRNVRMYPNPVKENLSLENLEDVQSISIYNVLGASVKKVVVQEERMDLNVAELSKGLYFVIFRDEKGNKSSHKLLKE